MYRLPASFASRIETLSDLRSRSETVLDSVRVDIEAKRLIDDFLGLAVVTGCTVADALDCPREDAEETYLTFANRDLYEAAFNGGPLKGMMGQYLLMANALWLLRRLRESLTAVSGWKKVNGDLTKRATLVKYQLERLLFPLEKDWRAGNFVSESFLQEAVSDLRKYRLL